MSRKGRKASRLAIRRRIRKKVRGSATRPRLAVHRTLNHVYCQAIDDDRGVTLAQASTTEKDLRGALKSCRSVTAATAVGKLIADRLRGMGLERVVFDRGGFLYHGRIKALAEAARESGLTF